MDSLDRQVIEAIEQKQTAELERLLKDGHANAKAESDDGQPAMHIAARLNNVPALEVLARWGGDIHGFDDKGNSPLLAAAGEGSVEAAQFLLDKGALPNVRNKAGETALHLAAKNGRRAMVEMLAQSAKFMLNFTTPDGRTAMMLAAEKNHAETVKALIEAGADGRATDATGRMAMDFAEKADSRNAQNVLGAYGAGNPMRFGVGIDFEAPRAATFDPRKTGRHSP